MLCIVVKIYIIEAKKEAILVILRNETNNYLCRQPEDMATKLPHIWNDNFGEF